MIWQTSRYAIDLRRPQVMGIINVTPDSFSDGGLNANPADAIRHCDALLEQGADLLDIGGESTRPGSQPMPLAEELARVMPVLRHAVQLGVPVSVDTNKPEVMRAALDCGADIINDVWALRQPGAAATVAAHPACGICIMHMHREPQTMQVAPMEGDVPAQVLAFLHQRADVLRALGIAANRIVVDPGIGFGKTVEQNFSLLAHQRELLAVGYPLVSGWSRKSPLGAITGLGLGERVVPSVAAALLCVERGARIVRVHDVAETVQALAVWQAAQPKTQQQPSCE